MEIKDKIKQRRLELRLTLEEVAIAVGVAKSTVKKWESGQIASMRQSKIVALARILQVDPTYLIIEDEQQNMNLGINHGIIGNQNSHNTIIVEEKPSGEIESELLILCKKMSMQQKNRLLTYAYELLGE
jgi:transcriptional regulator with XRE-family HTH domain